MSGYDFLKSQVLSCWWKVENVCDVVISSGKVFQTRGQQVYIMQVYIMLTITTIQSNPIWACTTMSALRYAS